MPMLALLAVYVGCAPGMGRLAHPRAADVGDDKISAGDYRWMLTSTALVLMMSIRWWALFYGGMVRKTHVLETPDQTVAIVAPPS